MKLCLTGSRTDGTSDLVILDDNGSVLGMAENVCMGFNSAEREVSINKNEVDLFEVDLYEVLEHIHVSASDPHGDAAIDKVNTLVLNLKADVEYRIAQLLN